MKVETEFCGHRVDGTGICIAESKLQEMVLDPVVTCSANVRSYLGSCVWFHSFIPDYALITEPLS